MRNVFKLILIIALLIVAFKLQKDAILSVFQANHYTATSDLNVRAGAGTRHPVLFTLQRGDEVELLAKNGKWFQIQYHDVKGYAYSKYLISGLSISNIAARLPQHPVLVLAIGITVVILLTIVFGTFSRSPVYKHRSHTHQHSWQSASKPMSTVDAEQRGTRSERALVQMLMNWGIPKHLIFHDLYIEKAGDNYAQVDLVVVSDVGIIVIEVKEYSGLIFGKGNQMEWTQLLAGGAQRYIFQNPIRQNQGHIAAIKRKINCTDNIPFYSIVVFYGNSKLHNVRFIPENIFVAKSERVLEVFNKIKQENPLYLYSKKDEVLKELKEGERNGVDINIQLRHRRRISDMLGTDRKFV